MEGRIAPRRRATITEKLEQIDQKVSLLMQRQYLTRERLDDLNRLMLEEHELIGASRFKGMDRLRKGKRPVGAVVEILLGTESAFYELVYFRAKMVGLRRVYIRGSVVFPHLLLLAMFREDPVIDGRMVLELPISEAARYCIPQQLFHPHKKPRKASK